MELVKQGGTYLFDLASGVRVDFTSSVVLTAANVSHHIPTDSSVHYHDMLKCSVVQDDGGSEPAAGHRGGKIHLHAPVTVGSAFYVRGYNVVCEAANVLPSNLDMRWRYEAQSDCAIVDLNGFDQTVTHLNGIGSFNGNDRNIITSAKPCTLTIDDTFSGASSANARIAVQGAITIVHGGTATQEFNSRDVATSGSTRVTCRDASTSPTTDRIIAPRGWIAKARASCSWTTSTSIFPKSCRLSLPGPPKGWRNCGTVVGGRRTSPARRRRARAG